MKFGSEGLFARMQDGFRQRLWAVSQKIRQRQLDAALERKEASRIEWKRKLEKWTAWEKKCHAVTCNGCGRLHTHCGCDHKPKLDELVSMLRNLAGISPSQGAARHVHDEDKLGGPPGFRSCGPNSWDNAVRAIDENR